ncbi:hypothetical protein CSC70_02510 [Pseudoxanthomonas kalamensis DSM 18571]|uniref:hypothetical protein n=1 Tax=Pseudoxanthomonas kalamensis TaxID=289483 RepID=UPI0013909F28|nr:hypothetical protein [Pseudoxanthomonas kalamensis]KAF1712411.1 hypothetical protein CSC70_02510 [Pseudoxanthomonas kalamensis DSM 18571]
MDFANTATAFLADPVDIDWAPASHASRQGPTLVKARIDLGQRAALTQEELDERAAVRRHEARARHRRLTFVAAAASLLTGTGLGIFGNLLSNQPLLLAGFGLIAVGAVLASLALSWLLETGLQPLNQYYRPYELPASAEEIGTLARISREDPELARHSQSWWLDNAPIRRQDVALAMAFHAANRDR